MEEDLTQLVVIILCDDFTGCDEMDNYFATEADTMINTNPKCIYFVDKFSFVVIFFGHQISIALLMSLKNLLGEN